MFEVPNTTYIFLYLFTKMYDNMVRNFALAYFMKENKCFPKGFNLQVFAWRGGSSFGRNSPINPVLVCWKASQNVLVLTANSFFREF